MQKQKLLFVCHGNICPFLKNRMNTGFVAYQNRKILLPYYLYTIYIYELR